MKKVYIYSPDLNFQRWAPLIEALKKYNNIRVYNETNSRQFLLSSKTLKQNALEVPNLFRLSRDIEEFSPDFIHILGEPSYLVTYFIARSFHKYSKITCRGAQNIYQPNAFPFAHFWHRNKRLIDSVICPAEFSREFYIRNGYKNTAVIGNGVSMDFFSPITEVSRKYDFGYVGKFIERKGISTLIQSLQEISEKKRIIFVGAGPLQNKITKFSNETHHEVTVQQRVTHDKLMPLFRSIYTVIVPSQYTDGTDWGIGRYSKLLATPWMEQFGMVVTEAMANGCQIICSDSGGLNEFRRLNCEVFKAGNKEMLIEKLRSASHFPIKDAVKRQQKVASFNWTEIAKKHTELWQSI